MFTLRNRRSRYRTPRTDGGYAMRSSLKEYKEVEEAAKKFVRSVTEGDSSYAKELFIDEAVLFGYLDGKL